MSVQLLFQMKISSNGNQPPLKAVSGDEMAGNAATDLIAYLSQNSGFA